MILITGASSGLGAALANLYHVDGKSLLITGRNEQRLSQVAESIINKEGITGKIPATLSTHPSDQTRINNLQNPNAMVSSYWETYWVSVTNGHIKVGKGNVSEENKFLEWKDPHPLQNLQWVGFSSWDTKISFRNTRVQN